MKLRTVLGVILVCSAAGAAESSVRTDRLGFRGHPWIDWRYPDGDSVGQNCEGNCGAGCNDSPDPCWTPEQFWVQEMLDEPQFTGVVDYRVTCDRFSGTLYVYGGQRYQAPMQETYHGFQTAGCLWHDKTCGEGWGFFGCLWPPDAFCPFDRHHREWSWVAWRNGWLWDTAEVIEGGCPCIGDQICP